MPFTDRAGGGASQVSLGAAADEADDMDGALEGISQGMYQYADAGGEGEAAMEAAKEGRYGDLTMFRHNTRMLMDHVRHHPSLYGNE